MSNYFSVRDGRIVSLAVIRNTPSPVLTSAGNTPESAVTPWEPGVLRPYPGHRAGRKVRLSAQSQHVPQCTREPTSTVSTRSASTVGRSQRGTRVTPRAYPRASGQLPRVV